MPRQNPQSPPTHSRATRRNILPTSNRQESNVVEEEVAETLNTHPSNMSFITLSQEQFTQLLNNNTQRQNRSTFSTCSARFNGGLNTTKIEDFITTILVYKESENISDDMALLSLPLLLEGYAANWWQGVKNEACSFSDAINLLKNSFAPPKPDWRIFAEIMQDKQNPMEPTDAFICRKRKLLAQLKEPMSENMGINLIYSQIRLDIREKCPRDSKHFY